MPQANWPPRDWYDWTMLVCGAGSLAVVAVALWQIAAGP